VAKGATCVLAFAKGVLPSGHGRAGTILTVACRLLTGDTSRGAGPMSLPSGKRVLSLHAHNSVMAEATPAAAAICRNVIAHPGPTVP